ncbi:hypothetical protein CKY12_07975 [Photorhabdus sp. S12-55]|nr:hypothetical protein CKY15_07195 [Photorhabdus sp. S7-51]RAW74549.1 hypothetical protein CKY14_05995 [Photorhabdus sp. S14-60]RAW79009.1 hypothetical protein CKY06_06155 [Photorhabdus sp. S15-56]RAW86154.1 hypothetical protein CKY09_08620 [Photorhabdus sp. S5P8-50]RAW86270.1 hypothetical protein CKY12_07975 [Photorhabdus sp. S12-55]
MRRDKPYTSVSLYSFSRDFAAQASMSVKCIITELSDQPALIKNCALDHSSEYLREALSVWLAAGVEIKYSAQDRDILTAIGFRPHMASLADNQEKYTPVQNLIYALRKAELVRQEPV